MSPIILNKLLTCDLVHLSFLYLFFILKRYFFHILFVLGCSILKVMISFHSKVRHQRILLNYFRLKDWKLRETIQQAMTPTIISRLIILSDCIIFWSRLRRIILSKVIRVIILCMYIYMYQTFFHLLSFSFFTF